jgi:hypothetical protein
MADDHPQNLAVTQLAAWYGRLAWLGVPILPELRPALAGLFIQVAETREPRPVGLA